MKKFAIDTSPLRKYRDFRNLWSAGLVTHFGSMITYVTLPFQIKEITHSFLAVGLMGVVELVPLIVFGLYGGVLADAVDRKKMVWATEFAALIMTLLLLGNSLLPNPNLVLIYIVAGTFAALNGLQRPSMDAILPRIVSHDDLPSASALMSLRGQFGVIVAPAVAGIVISNYGATYGYLIDVITFVIALIFLYKVRNIPPSANAAPPSFASLVEGLRYAVNRKDLLGTYLVDLAAMFFAMPTALFPFWADQVGAPWALGFFYAAGTIGATLITLTSGWIRNYPHHGRAIAIAALGWGVAITLAGVTNSLPVILLFLVLAGASDMVSALFRAAIWNQSIPDELRGRMAGIELLSYSVGPLGGQARAGGMAAATSLRTSVVGGGMLCIAFVFSISAAMPTFRRYDVRSNEFAVEAAKKRQKSGNI
ncbi:MAG: MFS transporter [Actinobacteria bacterium]|nr:MFS transporter [Actinomycetota bacterium]NDH13110.1 MFS transporter [Actinomycetota bacterium]